jgi:hypothetical protein
MKLNWVYYGLVLLTVEKIFQHIFVTLAFYYNWRDIASTVVVSPKLLMVSGAIVAALFVCSLWGLLKKQRWAIKLLTALAIFDLVGEFVAQGRFDPMSGLPWRNAHKIKRKTLACMQDVT